MSSRGALLFDLDGTLLDTADDLVAALNHVRQREGMTELDREPLRIHASSGARGLLKAGMPAPTSEAQQQGRVAAFLEYYAAHQLVYTQAYPGVLALLDFLDQEQIPWGIVTNKVEELTLPLLAELGWDQRTSCIVCGNTTAHSKPHPLPVATALARLTASAEHSWMIGDDIRDIESGRAAGCKTATAAWGYLGQGNTAEMLGADHILQQASDTPDLLSIDLTARQQAS
jgi:phosphoglycolate phosphatase